MMLQPIDSEEWQDLCLQISGLKHRLEIAEKRLAVLEPLNHRKQKRIAELQNQITKMNNIHINVERRLETQLRSVLERNETLQEEIADHQGFDNWAQYQEWLKGQGDG